MKIATVLNAHGNTPLVLDTIDAIKMWVSKDVAMIVDGATWVSWGIPAPIPVIKFQGFNHNYFRAPYRNLTLGLSNLANTFPDADWYCYCEYDSLFTSDKFKQDLKAAAEEGVWCLGNDLRVGSFKFEYLESFMKLSLPVSRYLLGCCVFYHKDFIAKLKEINFFDRFLNFTHPFEKGYFPGYAEQGGYDFGEHLFPTLAGALGGKVAEFARWNQVFEHWEGNYEKYPLRWKPEISWDDNFREACILHPVKLQSEIREIHRLKRKRINDRS